ncbi:MAG: EF-P beta-lysylation protein EpmB [Congregibacter sp.]
MNLLASDTQQSYRESWQEQLQNAIRTPQELAGAVGLSESALGYSAAADAQFPLLIPRAFAARMRRSDPQDPLLRQVLAMPVEIQVHEGYSTDPVDEVSRYGGTPGVLQKYQDRALLVLTGQCAVNCRYCFRRHYPYGDNTQSTSDRRLALKKLLDDKNLQEIILSGGDPLLLPDAQIASISDQIAASPNDVIVRIHTRLPIVIPDRVTDALISALQRPGMSVVIVLHCNHPNEIDLPTHSAIQKLVQAGLTVLNQSVLLAGVNDDADTLAQLSDCLFRAGALPYYLHTLDKVAGAAHFDLPVSSARVLAAQLAAIRPGYLVPKLMVETPGASSKRELAPDYIVAATQACETPLPSTSLDNIP